MNRVEKCIIWTRAHTPFPTDLITQFASGARGLTWTHCRLLTGLSTAELKDAGVTRRHLEAAAFVTAHQRSGLNTRALAISLLYGSGGRRPARR